MECIVFITIRSVVSYEGSTVFEFFYDFLFQYWGGKLNFMALRLKSCLLYKVLESLN